MNLTGQLENWMVKNAEGVSFKKPLIKEYAAKRSATYVGVARVGNLNLEECSTAATEGIILVDKLTSCRGILGGCGTLFEVQVTEYVLSPPSLASLAMAGFLK